jgi:hypothetical protein
MGRGSLTGCRKVSEYEQVTKQRYELYHAGLTDKQIAEQTDCSNRTIQAWRNRLGLPTVPRPKKEKIPGAKPTYLNFNNGVSYKVALPPEQWPMAQRFLARLEQERVNRQRVK